VVRDFAYAFATAGPTLALMAPRPPRNHHLLAKLYQRGFANENGQAGLLVRETGEWDAPRNIGTLFREPHFYAFVDEEGFVVRTSRSCWHGMLRALQVRASRHSGRTRSHCRPRSARAWDGSSRLR
jgi:hypothetical protein